MKTGSDSCRCGVSAPLAPPAGHKLSVNLLGNSQKHISGGNAGGNEGACVHSIAERLKSTLTADEIAELIAMLKI
ncbi:MAG: hypothetical protein AAGA30_07320 [Planctomycetota bacterium]